MNPVEADKFQNQNTGNMAALWIIAAGKECMKLTLFDMLPVRVCSSHLYPIHLTISKLQYRIASPSARFKVLSRLLYLSL